MYTDFLVNPNGWVGFEDDNSQYNNTSIPHVNAPRASIMGYWDDLNPLNAGNNTGEGTVHYDSDADRCVIWFNDVIRWGGLGTYNYQIVLYPDYTFKINYYSMEGNYGSGTIGIQNQTATDAMEVAYNTNYTTGDLTIQFFATPIWMLFETMSGVLPGYSEVTLPFLIDAFCC